MVNKKRYIRTYDELLSIEKFLERYKANPVEDWNRIMENLIYKAFCITGEDSYNTFLKNARLKKFDYIKMKKKYEEIKIDLGFFNDDILKYIAYIAAFDYFEQIGNPNLHVWLNAIDINQPFEDYDEHAGFSIVEVMGLNYGTNAIKGKLLSATRVLYGSFV